MHWGGDSRITSLLPPLWQKVPGFTLRPAPGGGFAYHCKIMDQAGLIDANISMGSNRGQRIPMKAHVAELKRVFERDGVPLVWSSIWAVAARGLKEGWQWLA